MEKCSAILLKVSLIHGIFLKLNKQYQIAQSVSIDKFGRLRVFEVIADFKIN